MPKSVRNAEFPCLAGKLLVAMPSMDDERFERTVIYISAHSDEGAMWLIINQPTDKITFSDLLDQMDIPDETKGREPDILLGGPCQTTRGFMIHSADYNSTEALSAHGDIHLTTNERILSDIAKGQGPHNVILAIGCSSWIKGQLEDEIMAGLWLVVEANPDLLFHTPFEERWEKALGSIGVKAALLSPTSGKA